MVGIRSPFLLELRLFSGIVSHEILRMTWLVTANGPCKLFIDPLYLLKKTCCFDVLKEPLTDHQWVRSICRRSDHAKQLQPHMTTLWPVRSFAQQLKRISDVTKVRSVLGNKTPDSANLLPSILWKIKL